MDSPADTVTLVEVGPRDGLQNEPRAIATADKVRLVSLLAAAGLTRIEVTSFVAAARIPQLADAALVMRSLPPLPGARLSALVPNLRGYHAARACGLQEIAVFTAASETFCQRNINCSIAQSLDRFAPVMAAAAADGVRVRGYVSCVTDCPFEGAIPPAAVAFVAARLVAMGCAEVSLGDTIGRGTPPRVGAMFDAVLAEVPAARLAGHFHDTGGAALANIAAGLERGIRVFDAAAGGLGGCPYAPGAPGNAATEAVADFLAAEGFRTGIDRAALAAAAAFARGLRA
jgi:hydroxymethylglutaryl-CoA lyase